MFIKALLIGLFCGCSISLYIISEKLSYSNEYGNYKGDLNDFADLDVITEEYSFIPYSLFRKQALKKYLMYFSF